MNNSSAPLFNDMTAHSPLDGGSGTRRSPLDGGSGTR
jgi:hypothetical protein